MSPARTSRSASPSSRRATPWASPRAALDAHPGERGAGAQRGPGPGPQRRGAFGLDGHLSARHDVERGRVRLVEELRARGERDVTGDPRETHDLVGRRPREERARFQDVDRLEGLGARAARRLQGPAGPQHPAVRGRVLEQGLEEPAHQGVLFREQPQEVAGAHRQAHGTLARPGRLAQASPAQDRLQAQGEGSPALGGLGVARLQGDGTLEEQQHPVGGRALPLEQVPGLRPGRPPQGREAEELRHRGEPEERNPAKALGRDHGGQRLPPARPSGLGGHPVRGESPRRRLEDELVAGGAVLEHVLQVVGEPPEPLLLDAVDGGGGQGLLVVVHELGQRVLDVAHPRPQEPVRLQGLLLEGRILEERHEPAAQRPLQHVVEVLGSPGVGPGVALHPPARDGHVPPGEDEAEQAVDAVHRPLPPLLEGPVEQRFPAIVAKEVEAQAQAAQGLPALGEGPLLDRGPREGELRVLAPEPLQGGEGLVAEDLVLPAQARQEEVHRALRRDAGQGRRDPAADLDVLRLLRQEVTERLHDSLAPAHEHVPRRVVERAVAEERHERRDEEVSPAPLPARRSGSPPGRPRGPGRA